MRETSLPVSSLAPARPALWNALLQALLLLICIQGARMVVTVLLYTWLNPAPTSPTWNLIDLAAYLVVGLALLILFRPSLADLGLAWGGLSRLSRGLVIGFGALWGLLVLTSGFIAPGLLLENAKNALLIPVFEELIFRGWVWDRLEKTLVTRQAGLLTWLASSALFSLWHLGYLDIYLLKVFPMNPRMAMGGFIVMKLATTLAIGLAVGFLRWRTRRVYGSLILHGLINLFGR